MPIDHDDTKDGECKTIYHYYEGITHEFHHELSQKKDVISLYFAWGDGRTVQHVFDGFHHYSSTFKLMNMYMHPVIEVNGTNVMEQYCVRLYD